MNLHPLAIKKFLAQPRDNHSWMKKLTLSEIDKALDQLDFSPARKDPALDQYQKVCILLGIAYKAFAFWLDMGTGKTRISLELLRYFYHLKELKIGLVLAPGESVLLGWERQIKEWEINIPYVILGNSSSKQKWSQLENFDNGLILATYTGFARMMSSLKKVKRKAKKKLIINHNQLKSVAQNINAVVFDEVTECGNHRSLNYRTCNQLSKFASIRLALAGIPFGRDPTMIWSQMHLIDHGETLGETLGLFRAAFFEESNNYWGGKDYIFKNELRDKLNQILRHRSIEYAESECHDLPKIIHSLEEVSLPIEAQAYYERFLKELKKQYTGYSEKKSAFIRMRQISSGFVGFKNDETGEKAEIGFAINPKLDRLIELIKGVPIGRKFVIFHEFTHSGRLITGRLAQEKIGFGWLHGSSKDAKLIQERFDFNENFPALVVNHKLGAYGLNLQRANYVFIYEAPLGAIANAQMRKRVPRKGQTRKVFEYDLVTRGTVDQRILMYHKEGGDLFKALIRNPAIL